MTKEQIPIETWSRLRRDVIFIVNQPSIDFNLHYAFVALFVLWKGIGTDQSMSVRHQVGVLEGYYPCKGVMRARKRNHRRATHTVSQKCVWIDRKSVV